MYDFFTDKEFIRRAKPVCREIMLDLQDLVRDEGFTCQFFGVGSAARNMYTRDGDGPIDFDYNLNIISCPDWEDGRSIKETARKCFNRAMREHDLADVQDSTSSLTTELIHFQDDPGMEFSIDVAIVTRDEDGNWYRLIHEKTGYAHLDRYYWNKVRDSKGLEDRVDWLKKHNGWTEVRERYLRIKNRYLTRQDHDHPSFVCYIEAVNEIYQKRHG